MIACEDDLEDIVEVLINNEATVALKNKVHVNWHARAYAGILKGGSYFINVSENFGHAHFMAIVIINMISGRPPVSIV